MALSNGGSQCSTLANFPIQTRRTRAELTVASCSTQRKPSAYVIVTSTKPNSAHSWVRWAASTNPTAKIGAGYSLHFRKPATLGPNTPADGNSSNPISKIGAQSQKSRKEQPSDFDRFDRFEYLPNSLCKII